MSEESEDLNKDIVYLIFLGLIIFFIVVGSWMEAKSFIFGHETTVIIVVGMIVSYIVWAISPDEEDRIILQFNSAIFFDFLLPAILFAVGFNMRRKEFFKNFVNITKFGIFGTLFTFFIYVGLTKLFFTCVHVTQYNPKDGTYTEFNLEWLEIFLVCSLLVSSDIIAAMSILKFDEAPHIFSIIIGEGLLNDVVVIVLY
jgi:sodium/hydrogen exchanger 8